MDWDELYRTEEYKMHWDSSHPSPELVGFVSSLQNIADWKVLDVGCGSGEDVIFLSKQVKDAYGIDISPTAIRIEADKAQTKGSNARFVTDSVFSLPFGDCSFHMITDRGCLHNLDLADWSHYESEVFRTLREDGILFLRGARKVEQYADDFTFIELGNMKKFFPDSKWRFKGPYSYTMFSDANEGFLYSNLFILRKSTGF